MRRGETPRITGRRGSAGSGRTVTHAWPNVSAARWIWACRAPMRFVCHACHSGGCDPSVIPARRNPSTERACAGVFTSSGSQLETARLARSLYSSVAVRGV